VLTSEGERLREILDALAHWAGTRPA